MANQSAQFDLSTAWIDQVSVVAYGKVRGAGNLVLQQELSSKSRIAIYMLGEGPWDSIVKLWINNAAVDPADTTKVHFHSGFDGEIGNGMSPSSNGPDQHVDNFWSSLGSFSTLTYSRYAYLMLNIPADPGAPSADLTVLADYQALRCRTFDASGNQTGFSWTQNPAWWICDFLIRKFILREAKVNQPLTASEKARIDWQSFSDAAAYCDVDIGGGTKRFSDGGVLFADPSMAADRAIEQMLLFCRGYLLERNGKIALRIDQPRSSVFTFRSDNIAPKSFEATKTNIRPGKNRIIGTLRDMNLATGSSDDATRMSLATVQIDHVSHQFAVGARGPGLSPMPSIQSLSLDFANNTPERAWRLAAYQLLRQLGADVDPGTAYRVPATGSWIGYEDSLAVENGDVTTVDSSISEEYGGAQFEILEIEERPDGSRAFSGLEYQPNAFPDVAPTQQGGEAPAPGTGISVPAGGANFSYRPTTNPLTAHDGGSNVTVSVAAFTMRYPDRDVAVSSGSVGSLSYGTTYYLYYDDLPRAGASVTFVATTTKETALSGAGRMFVGSIRAPAAAAPDTIGNNDGGATAQTGNLYTLRFAAWTDDPFAVGLPYSNAAKASDGNYGTSAVGTASVTAGLNASESWSGLPAFVSQATGINLKIRSSGAKSGTGVYSWRVRYSTDGGSTFTTIYSVSAAPALRDDAVSLPAATNLALVVVDALVTASGNGSATHNVTESLVEVQT